MVRSEAFHERPGKVHLAVQEYALIRNEHVLENRHHLLAAEDWIAHIKLVAFQLSGIAGLPAVDVANSRGACGNSTAYRPRLFTLAQAHRGHNKDFVGVEHAGLMQLGPADYYSTGSPLFDPQEKVRVYLVLGAPATVAFRVRHGPVHNKVFLLDPLPVLLKALMELSVVLAVALERSAVNRIGRVQAHTALETAACHGSAVALHLYLVNQVFCALVQVCEAVNLVIAQVRNRSQQVPALGSVRSVIGEGHGLPGGVYEAMFRQSVGLFAQRVGLKIQRFQRFKVLATSL